MISCANEVIEKGGIVYYTDTDSLYISADSWEIRENVLFVNGLPTTMNIDGNILGAWDLEKTFKTFVAFVPKRYGLIYNGKKDNDIFIRCAGVSQKFTKNFTLSDLQFNTLHKSLKSSNCENGKEINSVFKILGNGENVYVCDDGLSAQSKKFIRVGEKIVTKYKETKTVKKILYRED